MKTKRYKVIIQFFDTPAKGYIETAGTINQIENRLLHRKIWFRTRMRRVKSLTFKEL